MIDLVELKALVEKATSGDTEAQAAFAMYYPRLNLARQVLALSEEVKRLKENWHQAFKIAVGHQARATAAESEAQALRERMREINGIAREPTPDVADCPGGHKQQAAWLEHQILRIAALSTTPTKDPAP